MSALHIRFYRPTLQTLEGRDLLSTFTVTIIADSGPGSLRQALLDAGNDSGPNTIDFSISGTIAPASPLPAIRTPTTVDGSGQVVELLGSGTGDGLQFQANGGVTALTIDGYANAIDTRFGSVTVQNASLRHNNVGVLIFPESGVHSVIEGNRIVDNGVGVELDDLGTVQGNRIVGNTVGIRADGSRSVVSGNTVLRNGTGIAASSGTNLIQGNLVRRNTGDGVRLDEDGINNTVDGNTVQDNGADGIYTDRNGTTVTNNLVTGNAGNGVQVFGAYRQDMVSGNTITGNSNDGVLVRSAYQVMILSNSINGNGNLGIELANGANSDQAAPVLDSAIRSHGQTVVSGSLTSTPDTTFTLEFYGSSGALLLGTATVTTDDSGYAAFRVSVIATQGDSILATATGSNGTSEFSDPVAVLRRDDS